MRIPSYFRLFPKAPWSRTVSIRMVKLDLVPGRQENYSTVSEDSIYRNESRFYPLFVSTSAIRLTVVIIEMVLAAK